jgi:sarcosine/dimethylglycine N-methyltransferase
MTDITKTVQDHYTQGGLLDRIFAYLEKSGTDPARLTFEDLYPIDQLHARGGVATNDHIEFAGIDGDMHVLDIGCGVGGASRVIAATCGCRVTGIDLTPEYIDIARDLTGRCGLSDKVDYQQANATELSFDDETFDHVWCHNVTMNIEDKAAFADEVSRVLVSGGRFSCAELGLGPAGEPSFPLPWARDASSSFLVTPDDMCAALEGGGLRVIQQLDLNDINMAFRKEMQERAARGDAPAVASYVAMGDDMPERQQNLGRMAIEGRVVEHMILAEKP